MVRGAVHIVRPRDGRWRTRRGDRRYPQGRDGARARLHRRPHRLPAALPGGRVKRRTLLLCFAVGAAVLAYLIHRVGFSNLVSEARHTGPMFPVIFASYGLVYVCTTAAWRVILGNGNGSAPSL